MVYLTTAVPLSASRVLSRSVITKQVYTCSRGAYTLMRLSLQTKQLWMIIGMMYEEKTMLCFLSIQPESSFVQQIQQFSFLSKHGRCRQHDYYISNSDLSWR